MLVHEQRRAVVLRARHPQQILEAIPTARTLRYKGVDFVAVPHRIDEVRVLRNMGFKAPSPILHHYHWPRSPAIDKPFFAQTETAAFLTAHPRAYVLNGLGAGKTLSALWAYDYLRSQGHAGRLLVVSTLSTVDRTWGDTVFEHFPHLSFSVVHASNKERRARLLEIPADVYIINHDGLKVLREEFAERHDIDTVIVDEISEAARNARTDRWKAIDAIINRQPAKAGRPPRTCWGLTATPTPVRPTDAWAQCRLLTPHTVPPYFKRFEDSVMRQIGAFKWVERDNATEVVHRAMQPSIRFSREECVDLPPTTSATYEVALTSEQKRAYQSMLTKLVAEFEDGAVLAVNEAVKIGKLVQIACGVVYTSDGEQVSIPSLPRLQATAQLVRDAHTKTIVFVPFVSAVSIVAEYLRGEGFEVGMVHGSVGKSARNVIFSDFERGDLDIIVAQPAAMSHGLTLVAASTIVWYAPTNRPDTYEQANGRIVRPGQKHNTLIAHIEGTPIERKMYRRLIDRQAMQGLLLDMVVESREAQAA